MTKKLMALLLAVLMAVSLLPMPAMADDATTIQSLSEITGAGSYVLDKDKAEKDIVLTAPFVINADVTLELTGQKVTFKLDKSATNTDAAVFHVDKGSLTLKGKGTVIAPDNAYGILVKKDTTLNVFGEVSISGGTSGVKVLSGDSGVKINVNTLGTIESKNGINLSGASGTIKITEGTIKGSDTAIACDNTLGDIAEGAVYINGTAATAEQLAAKPAANALVFDNGKAPELTVSSAKRTAETEGTVTFTASKAGTYYYQLDGEAAAPADIIKDETKVELIRGENTVSLKELDANAHTVYLAAKDAFGNVSELKSAAIPAVIAAPAAPLWDGSKATWTGVEGVTDYLVQLYLGADAYGDPISVKGATVTDDLSGVMKNDGVYTFKVCAVGANTVGAWSETSGKTVRDTTAPGIKENGVQRTAQDTASIAFISDEDGTLYYALGDEPANIFDSALTLGIKKGEDNTLTLTDLTDSAAVTVRFAAKDALGNESAEQTVTVPLYLAAPTTLTWVDGTTTAMWSEVPGAASYNIQLFKDGAEVSPVVTVENATTYAFALNDTGVYTFKVQAVSGNVTSTWSDASSALTVDKSAPVISNTSASRTDASNGSVTFTSDEAGTVYYIVGGETPSQDDLANAESRKEIASGETKIDLSGLGTGATNVYLMVVDAAGNKSEIKTVTIPVYLSKPTMTDWYNGTTNARWNAVEGATAYNVQLLKDGNAFGNVTTVNGGATTSVDLASAMTEDGLYTFQVQATAEGTQSEWSDASPTSYKRDTQKPTITGEPSKRTGEKTAEFSFTSSEEGTYYYMVGLVNGGVPTPEQVADDKNPHGGCTNVKTTIKLTDIADKNARKVYVVVRDKSGNLSSLFTIDIPAYSAAPTPTPTAPPVTPTPTPAPTTYTVTLQGGTGYTIAATGGSKSPVNAGGSFSFTVTPSSGYTRGNGFAVKANGTTLTSNNGVYTISNINTNQTVSVSGIVKSQTNNGGTLPAAPAITTTTLAAATMGKEYRQQITATGGTPITWSYSGTLPDGMTLAANTGILSGTPTQEGSFRFAVKATNSTGFSTRQMTLVVAGSEYSVTKGANSEWTQGGDKGIDFSGSGKGTFTVKVDGAAVAAGKYTASSDGSTVTLKPEYLDTLAAGSHTVTLVYTDGSAKAKFTIKAKDKTVAPTVSSQPTDADVAPDGSATFTVTASGTTPLLCQWQVDKNDGSGWTDISGAVNASYTVEKVTAEQNGWKYRCVIKNAAGSVESNAATLTIKEAIGDVKKNDDTKDSNSGGLGRILLITGIVVAVLALAAGLYFYFRRRKSTRYMD